MELKEERCWYRAVLLRFPPACNMRKAESSVQGEDDSILPPRWPLASPAWVRQKVRGWPEWSPGDGLSGGEVVETLKKV